MKWLANHQDPKGYWDCDDFMKMCRSGPRCTGPGGAPYDPGVTGLALLAFMGAGNIYDHGPYRKAVLRGIRYIDGTQDPEGCFGSRTSVHFIYNTAIATEALAKAYSMTRSPWLEPAVQQGLDFILKARSPYVAWRYGVQPQDNDTSVSAWAFMALMTDKRGGFQVPQSALDGMKAWLDKMTDPLSGKVGYVTRGVSPARLTTDARAFPVAKSESLTAAGLLIRMLMGGNPQKSKLLHQEMVLVEKCLPTWNEKDGSIDMYYWYYGTVAMYRVGGAVWVRWRKAIKSAILDHQIRSGCPRGSWDPVGPWGKEGGRVYSTALMTICLEFYYGDAPIAGGK